jgi:hypothetical protein
VIKFYCNHTYKVWLQSKCMCSKTEAPLSSHSVSASEDEDNVQSQPDPKTEQAPKLQWTLPSHLQKSKVHTLTVGPRAKNDSEIQNTSMVALFYLVLSCCNLQKLSYCLWWRQTDIITGAWMTVLTRTFFPTWQLKPKCLCYRQ